MFRHHRYQRSRPAKIRLGIAAVAGFLAAAPAAADEPCAPTAPDHPLRLLVDQINDPDRGADLRNDWNIDRAVWIEPECVRDANGALRLVAPARAEIHASYASGGAEYDQATGTLLDAGKSPSGIRLLIPRSYADEPTRRFITRAPQGPLNEYTSDGFGIFFEKHLLRRGVLICGQNSYFPDFLDTPNSFLELGKRVNQGTRVALEMMRAGFGLPAPHFVYAEGQSRGSNVLAMAVETPGTPFDGVLLERGGGWMAPRTREIPGILKTLRAANAADAAVLATYLGQIGRFTTITRADGTTRTGVISAALDLDLRFFYGIPPTAQVLFPEVPPFDRYPQITFRFNGVSIDTLLAGRPGARVPGPGPFRVVLGEIDPEYLAAVDAGMVLLRDWDPAERPHPVQHAVDELEASGRIHTKVLKVHGTRDSESYPSLHIGYVQKVIDAGRSDLIRNYMVPGLGHAQATGLETFKDAGGNTVTMGRRLDHLDALLTWVEMGVEPGEIPFVNPSNPSASIFVKGAHQLGFQTDPTAYFEKMEGLR